MDLWTKAFIGKLLFEFIQFLSQHKLFVSCNRNRRTPHIFIVQIPFILTANNCSIPMFQLNNQHIAMSNNNQIKFTFFTLFYISKAKARVSFPRENGFVKSLSFYFLVIFRSLKGLFDFFNSLNLMLS